MVGKRGVWWWLGSVGWAVALLKKGGRLQEGEGGMGGGAAGDDGVEGWRWSQEGID